MCSGWSGMSYRTRPQPWARAGRRWRVSPRPSLVAGPSGEPPRSPRPRHYSRRGMLATKERTQGHYEVTKTPFGTDYVWVEGEEEGEKRLLDEILHPWQAAYAEWVKEERAHPEFQEWLEMEALDRASEATEGGLEA